MLLGYAMQREEIRRYSYVHMMTGSFPVRKEQTFSVYKGKKKERRHIFFFSHSSFSPVVEVEETKKKDLSLAR